MVFNRSYIIKKKQISTLILLVLVLVVTIYVKHLNPINYGSAHSSQATPTEIFSLWNDTSPTLDGSINFNSSSLATEWSAAAVYSLFDFDKNLDSKILLQNDDINLYIGLDLVNFQTETPASTWGAAIYIDIDHNGIFTNIDRAIILKADPTAVVYYNSFNDETETWDEIESDSPGIPLPTFQILMNTAFDTSYFESLNHRQYEIRIPLAILGISNGNITGIGFEAFENYDSLDEEITWPYVSSTPSNMRVAAGFLGDIYIGKDTGLANYYADYVIEENTNLKYDVIGENKGVFLGTIDVDNNGDLEIVVSSNDTDTDKDYLLAIYDFIDGEMTRIWASWTTSHQSKMFQVKGIAAFDFNGDSEEELYVCGEDSRLLRFSNWNDLTKDFDESKYVFIHSPGLMGYIAIGDPDNDATNEIVCGDQQGDLLILSYDSDKDEFDNDEDSPFDPPKIDTEDIAKIHAIEVADTDNDSKDEILVLVQPYSDPEVPITLLQIFRRFANKYLDEITDNLPVGSISTTLDYNGHTILVGEAANNGEIMTIIVGRDYLRMFEQQTYTDLAPPLELLVNNGSYNPSLAGGAIIADIDNDTRNELIFGANNGTMYIGEVVDQGTSYEFVLEWSSDIGSSPGNREAITVFDFDKDGDNEIIVGDNFGQIQLIGKSNPPIISITSPTSGSTFSIPQALITWDASDDFAIHHYDILVESALFNRIPGSQNSILVSIAGLDDHIEVIAFDVNGKNSSDSINIGFTAGAPQVHILSPENNYYVNNASIIVYYENIDLTGDFSHYEVWVNDILLQNNSIEWVLVPTFSDGLFNITIVGVDLAKNRGKSTIFITKDSSAPFISITSPLTGSYIKNPEIDVHWSASDAISGISHFDIIKDGSYLRSTTSFHETVSLEVDKSYQFEIEAFDLLGNSRSALLTITKDSVEPNVTILSHQTGDILTDTTLNLNWDSSDNHFGSGIHHTEVSINQITKYSGTDESAAILLDQEGRTDVLLTTFDRAGNSKTAYVSLILDVSDPYINITNPVDGYTTGFDFILLNWESVDNGTGIQEYQLYVNGISYQNITDSTIHNAQVNIPVDTTSTITIRALDYIDRFFTDSISITQNSSLPEVLITDPSENQSYSSTPQFDLSWDIANMPNISYFEIYVNGSKDYTLDNLTRYQLVDLGNITISEFPLFNITILAISMNPNENYTDSIWLVIDQSMPFISIIIPENNTIVTNQGLYVQWTGNDFGSGLLSYQILLDNETQIFCTCLRNYHYIYFDSGDKNYTLAIIAQDKANNQANSSIQLAVVILGPEIQTNISTVYYTNNEEFSFNFSITNPRNGVKSYYILMDDNPVFSYNSYPIILLDPYSIQVNVSTIHYTTPIEGSHILSIGIIDSFSREIIQNNLIIVDKTNPTIIPSIDIDSWSYNFDDIIELTQNGEEPAENNHSILVRVSDNNVIDKVIFTIIGTNFSETMDMVITQTTRQQTNSYYIILDIGTLASGNYNITITAFDKAGNSYEITTKITILPPVTIPWLFQGNNLVFFSVGLFDAIILVVVFAIAIRKPILNRNWQGDVIAVMYIRNTGLVCTSVQYDPQQIQEEQLVGGATVAIQEILNEYAGRKDRKTIRTLQIANKSLLLTTGNYGYGAVVVKALKPKHKDLIKAFTKRFEKNYEEALKNIYYVDSVGFRNAERLVERFFGRVGTSIEQITKLGITEQLQEIQEIKPEEQKVEDLERKELLEDITPIDELVNRISREAKNRLMKVLENTPKIIIALVEQQMEYADKLANDLANDIQFLMKIERKNTDFNYFIQSMLYITTEIDNAIEKGKHGFNHEMQLAVERASKIWFDEIADKWSDIQ